MRLLFLGDVVGKPGRRAVERWTKPLREELGADLVLANAENVASGFGLTTETAEFLFDHGVQVLTGGNHVFDKEEGHGILDRDPRIVRPINLPPGAPGKGIGLYEVGETLVAVLNAQGRHFMRPIDCPFRTLDTALETLADRTAVVVVDFHAEATAEKVAMGCYLDGRVSAVLGTHTHVPTADERILPQGTAYITDVGMTGPYDSVIGMQKDVALRRMLGGIPVRSRVAEGGITLCGVVVDIDPITGRATSIERIRKEWED